MRELIIPIIILSIICTIGWHVVDKGKRVFEKINRTNIIEQYEEKIR